MLLFCANAHFNEPVLNALKVIKELPNYAYRLRIF